ncbi:MAG TPA: sensor domain-containing diguanylate cyclase [Vicinamibacteria bacterium]|nr:sensor domain-containing diguanylate cyclase [Vicinamibacteria bacterium]
MKARVAVFSGPALRKNLHATREDGLDYEFFPAAGLARPLAGEAFEGALVELSPDCTPASLRALRRALPRKPVGSLSLRCDARILKRSREIGYDFHLGSWRTGDPPAREVLAHFEAARAGNGRARGAGDTQARLRTTTRRLAILTDIVKTANSILEPRKVIELIMAKVQELIPSEAWSILMLDEEKQELTFELALGEKGKDVAAFRVKVGEGIAGWVAQTGEPTIVNDTSRDPRFARRFDASTQFQTRSVLCAPLISRGRTIGVVQVINKEGGKAPGRFTQGDLELLNTLVEPCAIAIENAILFQRTEQLTITDDLTRLFNSRYLNLYIGREIKRCKRHGIPLSIIFLDLDGFKSVNDAHGHLAGSRTLTEVGRILVEAVRESDILARYGGDEFVVVLPETPPSGALVIAERIRKAIESHVFLKDVGLEARISASFGIASYPDHALSPEGLIQKADQAMYRVKERDKNGIEVAV